MKIGISTASLFLRLNNEDALPLLNEWGVDTAEVFLTSFSEYDPSFARTLNAAKGGLNVHSVHVLNTQFEPQLYAKHARVREDAYFWLKRAMESARILGAKHYTFHGIARLKRTFREDFLRTGEETQKIFAFCNEYGVRLCYENVEWAFFNRPAVFYELKRACPALGGVLDLKQARLSGYDYKEYLAAMGSSLTHVHASDFNGEKMILPGFGQFDFDELFKRLRGEGFDGAVLVENYADDYTDFLQLKTSYEFLKEKSEKYYGKN